MILILSLILYFVGVVVAGVVGECYQRSNNYNEVLDRLSFNEYFPRFVWPIFLVMGGFLLLGIMLDVLIKAIAHCVCPNVKKDK